MMLHALLAVCLAAHGLLAGNPQPLRIAGPAQSPVWQFYQRLLTLYQIQPAVFAGNFAKLPTTGDEHVYAFMRQRGPALVTVGAGLAGAEGSTTAP